MSFFHCGKILFILSSALLSHSFLSSLSFLPVPFCLFKHCLTLKTTWGGKAYNLKLNRITAFLHVCLYTGKKGLLKASPWRISCSKPNPVNENIHPWHKCWLGTSYVPNSGKHTHTPFPPSRSSQPSVGKENKSGKKQLGHRGMEISIGTWKNSGPRLGERGKVTETGCGCIWKTVPTGSRNTEELV